MATSWTLVGLTRGATGICILAGNKHSQFLEIKSIIALILNSTCL